DLPNPDSTYVSSTGAGSVGTEFLGSSVTSPSGISTSPSLIQLVDPYFKYAEVTLHGYLLFDVNKKRCQGDFIHVSYTFTRTYTTSDDAQWINYNNSRHLMKAANIIAPRNTNPPFAPAMPANPIGINTLSNNMVVLSCYPNPATDHINLQYCMNETTNVLLTITDLNGKTVYTSYWVKAIKGTNNGSVNISDLPEGIYMVNITTAGNRYSKKIVKIK
ncbi:MAG TPA: T9SS type A sorting domain-containing protein, partial [Bacteroidia bacterium]|nr:T9SS type A sorting domain-containing protein [Bacteroidia bacterium]